VYLFINGETSLISFKSITYNQFIYKAHAYVK